MTTTLDRPIVIVGAPRSGTNMLRDVLSSLPGLGTWPCDEINYIWRHGNVRHPTDELAPGHATSAVRRYVRRQFERQQVRQGGGRVVEKTCANSLRVGFVDQILPEARYLHIVRDGRDAAASARKRWRAELDLAYILRKARFVPPSDLPYYGSRYLMNRLYRLVSRESRLRTWGPRFEGIDEVLAREGLLAACAHQWRRCVERAAAGLSDVDPSRVLEVRYEELVERPREQLGGILEFLEVARGGIDLDAVTAGISPRNVGKWRRDLTPDEVAEITPIVGPVGSHATRA